MYLKVMQIDPVMAASMLANNDKNRKLSQRHVNKLASELSGGKWVLNGQTIAFDSKGRLLDGQHRLHAIIQSGVTANIAVAKDVIDERAFETYDQTAKKRGIHDIVAMKGVENAVKITAIARRLVSWDRTIDKSAFSLAGEGWRGHVGHEVISCVGNHLDEIKHMQDALKLSLPHRKCRAGSSLIAALILCNRIDPATTDAFIQGLKTGGGYPVESPIGALRDKLINPPKRNGLLWETEVMALTIKSWNRYFAGKSMRLLRWNLGGGAPEKFPIPGDIKC